MYDPEELPPSPPSRVEEPAALSRDARPVRRSGPREKLLFAGERALSEEELLSLVLGSGVAGQPVREVARALLRDAGDVVRLLARSARELSAVRGVGPARAARLAAALELARRALSAPMPPRACVRSGAEVDRIYRARLAALERECFLVLLLDARHRIFREEVVVEGTLVAAPVDAREVFLPAVRWRAAAVLVAHNHPSGDPRPSPADHEVTRRLQRAGELLGIPLVDHVVIAREGYVSFLENGWL
ncbi:MAG: DNA repair protein RadC [Planctomycetes bacterium]|nr:DNA repair protein RadC [Planctomycetota bacterium]